MQKHLPFAASLLLSMVLTIIVTSCFRQRADAPVAEMRFGSYSEPATLDPLSPANTADGRSLLFNVFEGLVKPDTEGALQPCIAESVTIEEAGRVYLFKLRENIRFHDGSPLTSADAQFSLDTAKAAGFIGFDAVESIETEGDYGIRLTLTHPDPEFLPYLTVGIVKAGSADRDRNAVGSGPFYIESHTLQQSLVLRKFADYWQEGIPRLEKITILFFADSDAAILGLRGGSIDGVTLYSGYVDQLDPERFDIVSGYSAAAQLLALNNSAAPFDDIRVRQAINYGIDIQEIIDTAFYGRGQPSGSPLIPGLAAYYEQSLADPYPVDYEKALSLLAQAGYGEGGQTLSLTITVPSNFTVHIDTAQVIASQLARIGINAGIQLVDWPTWLSDVYRDRNYQATIISLDSPIVSPRGFLSRYRAGSFDNFINFSSAEFDRVYDAILTETDEERRVDLYKEAQRIISAGAASVFIQDIMRFQVFRAADSSGAGAYGGVLNYPLYVVDFAAMYSK